MKVEEYIRELAEQEFRNNLLRVDFFGPYDGFDTMAEVVLQHDEDDDVILDKLTKIYFTARDKGLFVPVSWVVAEWADDGVDSPAD